MRRLRKIIENFVVCECQKIQQNPMYLFKNGEKVESLCKPIEKIKCPMCHGTGLRVKKKIFFYPDDR